MLTTLTNRNSKFYAIANFGVWNHRTHALITLARRCSSDAFNDVYGQVQVQDNCVRQMRGKRIGSITPTTRVVDSHSKFGPTNLTYSLLDYTHLDCPSLHHTLPWTVNRRWIAEANSSDFTFHRTVCVYIWILLRSCCTCCWVLSPCANLCIILSIL